MSLVTGTVEGLDPQLFIFIFDGVFCVDLVELHLGVCLELQTA